MKFNRECLNTLVKFIEEHLKFQNPQGIEGSDFNIERVYLSEFIKSYPSYPIEEVKYCYYLIRTMDYIIEDNAGSNDSPCVKGFTSKGCEMLLKDIHR